MKQLKINNQFVTQKKISSGSFGIVMLGIDQKNGNQVAIKIERPENEHLRSLEREVEILSRLSNVKGVPQMFYYGWEDSYNVIVMEMLQKDLSSILKQRKKLSLKSVFQLSIELVLILEEIHKQGVLHRDLKPENIMLDEKNKVYLIDFGISKIYIRKNGILMYYLKLCQQALLKIECHSQVLPDMHQQQRIKDMNQEERMIWSHCFMLCYTVSKVQYFTMAKPKACIVNALIKDFMGENQQLQSYNQLGALLSTFFIFVIQQINKFQKYLSCFTKLLYLIFFTRTIPDDQRTQKIGEIKETIDVKELFKDLPNEFIKIYEYLRKLTYASEPDYKTIVKLMQQAAKHSNIFLDYKYEWDAQLNNYDKNMNRYGTLQTDELPLKQFEKFSSNLLNCNNLVAQTPSKFKQLQPPINKQESNQNSNSNYGSGNQNLSIYNSMGIIYQRSIDEISEELQEPIPDEVKSHNKICLKTLPDTLKKPGTFFKTTQFDEDEQLKEDHFLSEKYHSLSAQVTTILQNHKK